MKRIALVATLGALAFAPAAYADTTINWLHIASNPPEVQLMTDAAKEYEAAHPGIHVNMQFLENEAFKAKLTTLLQSDQAPDVFYSWGGGVLSDQVKAGVMGPIESNVPDDVKAAIGPAGIGAFTRDGHLYGLAQNVSEVVFWYNKKLLAQAKVDPSTMGTWDGFIAGVKALKAAGITPIALGNKDKWPTAFYWDYLAVRLGGQDEFNDAAAGKGDGFAGADYVEAGKKLLELAQLQPFQEGFEAASYGDASGYFGDGKAALHLMGDWDYGAMKDNSASKKGLPDEDLGIMPFPSVAGAKGDPTDVLGGINGWIFSKKASPEAVKFMDWYLSKDNMSKFAKGGYFIPITAGASDALANPFQQEVAKNLGKAHWLAIFFDQQLGPSVGGTVNDISAALATNSMTAEDAANQMKQAVQDAQ
jgi:raffinose/stachyose/melibiose transport system substrate-binding protein